VWRYQPLADWRRATLVRLCAPVYYASLNLRRYLLHVIRKIFGDRASAYAWQRVWPCPNRSSAYIPFCAAEHIMARARLPLRTPRLYARGISCGLETALEFN